MPQLRLIVRIPTTGKPVLRTLHDFNLILPPISGVLLFFLGKNVLDFFRVGVTDDDIFGAMTDGDGEV